MGNSESSVVVDNQEFSLNHPKISNAVSIKTKQKEYLDVTYPITNTKEYVQWSDRLKESFAQDSQWCFHPNKHQYKKSGMCGNSGTAHVQYDNYPFLLSDQIENRKSEGKNRFSEFQIWYLISALTELGGKYHEKNEKVGDIRPENIFLNQEGKMKIATKQSWPKEISGYEKAFFDKEKVYLAPEQLKEIEVGRAKPNSNPLAAEIFSIGLTTLDTMLLDTSESLYSEGLFDRSALQDKKQILNTDPNYSALLKSVVLNFLQTNPANRIQLNELEKWMQPNRDNILNFKPFSANNIPIKIEQTSGRNPIVKKYKENKDIFVPQSQIVQLKKPESIQNVSSGVPQRVTYQTESANNYNQPPPIRNTMDYQPQIGDQNQTRQFFNQTASSSTQQYLSQPKIEKYSQIPIQEKKVQVTETVPPTSNITYQKKVQARENLNESSPEIDTAKIKESLESIDARIANSRRLFPS